MRSKRSVNWLVYKHIVIITFEKKANPHHVEKLDIWKRHLLNKITSMTDQLF